MTAAPPLGQKDRRQQYKAGVVMGYSSSTATSPKSVCQGWRKDFVCVRPVLQTGPVVTYPVKLSRGAFRVTDERPADLRV